MKRCLFLLAVAAIAFCMSVVSGYAEKSVRPETSGRTIVDTVGRKVTIPQVVNRIVVTCYGGASHEISVLGGAEKIVAQPSMKRFSQLTKIYPQFVATPDAGSFNSVNLEHIMMLKPDLVVVGVTSVQGNGAIESTGVPVVVVAIGRADLQGLLKEFKVMGEILGGEDIAEKLISYWKARLDFIRKRVDPIPDRARKRVLYMSAASPLSAEGGLWWGHHFITAAGGHNVSRQVTYGRQLTIETLLLWNPDVIIMPMGRTSRNSPDSVKTDPRMKNIKAVRDGAVYGCPIGAFWWDRPSPEAILGIMWLAKTLYPDAMKELDLKKETMTFFKTFYKYQLSDREYKSFFDQGVG